MISIARLSITEKAVTLNGGALIQYLAGLASPEWRFFAEWLESAPTEWYRSNELHILTAWTKGAEF